MKAGRAAKKADAPAPSTVPTSPAVPQALRGQFLRHDRGPRARRRGLGLAQ
jgi:hypothetical protein